MVKKSRIIKLDKDEAVVESSLTRCGGGYVVKVPPDVGEVFRGARVIVTIARVDREVGNNGGKVVGSNYVSGDEFVRCVDMCRGLSGREGDICVKKCLGVV